MRAAALSVGIIMMTGVAGAVAIPIASQTGNISVGVIPTTRVFARVSQTESQSVLDRLSSAGHFSGAGRLAVPSNGFVSSSPGLDLDGAHWGHAADQQIADGIVVVTGLGTLPFIPRRHLGPVPFE